MFTRQAALVDFVTTLSAVCALHSRSKVARSGSSASDLLKEHCTVHAVTIDKMCRMAIIVPHACRLLTFASAKQWLWDAARETVFATL
jgi:hypothetical protein